MENPINFVPEEEMPEDYFSTGIGWYLHGELEQDAKFDICACSVNPRNVEEGIHKVTYKGNVEATLFCWQIKTDNYVQHRGLIVKNTDIKSFNFANKRFESRSQTL